MIKEWGWHIDRPDMSVMQLLAFAITRAIMGILWADLPGMDHQPGNSSGKLPDRNIEKGPINSICIMEIQIIPVLDENSEIMRALPGDTADHDLLAGPNPDPCWDPN